MSPVKLQLEGNWNQLLNKARLRWPALAECELEEVEGDLDLLISYLQKRYDMSIAEAETEIQALIDSTDQNGGAFDASINDQENREGRLTC